jgi:polyisoprenoid-binding protein YceI
LRKTLLASLLVLCAAGLVAAAVLLRPALGPSRADSRGSAAQHAAGRRPTTTAASASHADDDDDDEDGDAATPVRRRAARAAPVWTVDKAASRLSFRAVMDGVPFDGVIRSWDAQIAFDPKNLPNSHAAFTADTTSALTGQPIKDQALPNSEWLATDAYPQATLVTRSITEVSPGHYQAAADVRIRGVRWRTTLPFTVDISHDVGRMDATLTLDRRTFGIGEGPFNSPAPVEPAVQVIMKLVAKRSR